MQNELIWFFIFSLDLETANREIGIIYMLYNIGVFIIIMAKYELILWTLCREINELKEICFSSTFIYLILEVYMNDYVDLSLCVILLCLC